MFDDQIQTGEFEGKLVVFTAPSGAGKSTIVRHLLDKYHQIAFSVSATTRGKRKHEKEGKHYYFFSHEKFEECIQKDAFVEWEEVYENQFYGTLHSEIERLWELKKHIIFDIDVKGAFSIKEKYGRSCLTVFIKPPSVHELINRLKLRKTESDYSLVQRIRKIENELKFEEKFDQVIINDLLDVALKEAEIILETFLGLETAD